MVKTPKIKLNFFIITVSIFAAMGGLLFGYDTGVISGALGLVQSRFHLGTGASEWVVSSVVFGAMVGAIMSGQLADRFSRRSMLLLAGIAFVVGTLLCSFALHIETLLIGRLVIGIAIGVASYITPLYISEISPPEYRGGLVILNTIMVTGGIVVAYLVDFSFANVHQGWRWMFGMGLIPAVLLCFGVLFLPQSPRWIVKKGNLALARKILAKLYNNTGAEEEFQRIVEITKSKSNRSWKDLLNRKMSVVLLVGCALAVMQQTCGINAILYYAPTIFKNAGFHSAKAQMLATTGIGLMNVLMTVVAMLIVDKVGRRSLLLTGFAITTLSLAVVAGTYHFGGSSEISKIVLMASLLSFIIGYAVSIGCVFWLMIAEIFPLNLRGKAMCIATTCNWLVNCIVSATFLTLLNAVGSTWVFAGFSGMCLLSWLFCFYFVPETKSMSLEKIEQHINSGRKFRKLGVPQKLVSEEKMRKVA